MHIRIIFNLQVFISCYTYHEVLPTMDVQYPTQFAFSNGIIAILNNNSVRVQSLDSSLHSQEDKHFITQQISVAGIDQLNDITLVWNQTCLQIFKLKQSFTENIIHFNITSPLIKAGFILNNSIYSLFNDSIKIIDIQDFENSTNHQISQETFYLQYPENITSKSLNMINEIYSKINNSIKTYGEQIQLINIQNHVSYIPQIQFTSDIFLADSFDNISIIAFKNKTIQFTDLQNQSNNHLSNLTLPYQKIRDNSSEQLKLKILFTYHHTIVFAFYNTRTICYQYYQKKKFGTILCMQTEEKITILDLQYNHKNKKLVFLLESRQKYYVDQYDQCQILYQLHDTTCNICFALNCPRTCHQLKCSEQEMLVRQRVMSQTILMVFILVAVGLLCNFLKSMNFGVVRKGIASVFMFVFCSIPQSLFQCLKFIKLRMGNFFLRMKNSVRHIPLQNSPCPICLDILRSPVYFPCQRHMACNQCMQEYQQQFTNHQQRCPFRD